jgi:hypothetical protein
MRIAPDLLVGSIYIMHRIQKYYRHTFTIFFRLRGIVYVEDLQFDDNRPFDPWFLCSVMNVALKTAARQKRVDPLEDNPAVEWLGRNGLLRLAVGLDALHKTAAREN